jgi:hypothetical protein
MSSAYVQHAPPPIRRKVKRLGAGADRRLLGRGRWTGVGWSRDWPQTPGRGSGGAERVPAARTDDPPARVAHEFRCVEPDTVGPAPSRRLSVDEYVRSVRDILNVDVAALAEQALPPDLRADGFSNTAQVLQFEHVEGYSELASAVSGRVDVGLLHALGGCSNLSSECTAAFTETLGERLFRRSILSEEREVFASLFSVAESESDGFDTGARLVLEAMLQSPGFLYRLERAIEEGERIGDFELATRLSYFILGSSPDTELLAAAQAGLDNARLGVQIRRLLSDDRAREGAVAFARDWLNLDRLPDLQRDPERFVAWRSGIGEALRAETMALFEALAFSENTSLARLFDARQTFVTPAVAELYGIESSGSGLRPVDLSDVPERRGILTHDSVLTVGGSRASMVERGLWILENVLCGEVAAPDVDVVMQMGELAPGLSQRHYAEERLASDGCAGCHVQMDPLAFGLARFDGAGAYRESDEHGNDLRSDGMVMVPGSPTQKPFETVAELASILADEPRVMECVALKATQYAIGRELVAADGCALNEIRNSFEKADHTWPALVEAIATSKIFTHGRPR